MASNIKIVGNILNTTQVSRYSEEDIKLIASQRIQEDFGGTNDYIEYYIYDVAENLLNTNYNYLKYKLPSTVSLKPGVTTIPNTTGEIQTENIGIDSTLATPTSSLYPIIEIDPVQDLQDLGYSSGEFKVRYNLFQTKLSNYIDSALFVKEISQDRTEIRLASTTLTNDEIESVTLSLIDEINTSPYYVSYLLNFGDNKQYVTVNTALNKAPEGYEVLFKLYEPLPLEIQEKQTLWIVEEKVEPYIFDINLDKLIIPPPPPTLRGPNFDIPISENQGTVSSTYQTYDALVNNIQSLQQNSYHNILNLLATQSIQINVDYTDYSNFIFFGSANQRLVNFRNKISDIEYYNNFINVSSSFTSSIPSLIPEINRYSANISNIISKFDGYESYLYFESSSHAWPKTTSTKPFTLYSVTSSQAITWYNTNISTAQSYDATNYNNLEYAVPVYLRDDANNQPFLVFLNMIGQYFDNIWIYLKAVTDINLANNSLTEGISKDLVYERLKSLGLKLYNSQAGENVNQYLIGANTGSSVWDNNTTITGSYLNNIPRKDLVSELYKRIYHNLPLLLKTKGTVTGLETLMTIFGIPNQIYYTIGSSSFYTPTGSAATASILNVKEYGGGLKTSLIQGYNNDKVRIVQNTITGSVLSPILSLQTFPTDANDFRENDSHYIDISFSPQNQIDNYISGAIASNNPTWSLDDYIGDPRQQYSSSYIDLDAQRKLYFETGVSGYAPFTASLLDYNGFIRLVEYFDNSLFKMLEDFVPERASLSTGVTINSPVLERNKAVYANPTATTTQSVYEAEYSASTISSTYGTFYNALSSSNNTMGWFDGELSGSVVDVNQYFEDNYNPYLQPTGTIDRNAFNHSDWNVLLNNVSRSVQSSYRKKVDNYNFNYALTPICYQYTITSEVSNPTTWVYKECIPGGLLKQIILPKNAERLICSAIIPYCISGCSVSAPTLESECTKYNITFPAELQDSYLSLQSYNRSRYEGSKLTSLVYNTYTSASYTGSDGFTIQRGDKSYGKTAAIDRQSYKIGWVKNIPSQSLNFFEKTQIQLKYLIDKNLNTTELSGNNDNLFEVQNIFKSGKPIKISISNPSSPSNQITLNSTHNIFRGGYRYDPIFYRENNETLVFTSTQPVTQSTNYIGVKALDNHTYTYDIDSNVSSGRQPSANTGYKYSIDDIETQDYPIAYIEYSPTQWAAKLSTSGFENNRAINLFLASNLPSNNFSINSNAYVYGFNLLRFDNIKINNEPSPETYRTEGPYIYKVPRTSLYTIKTTINSYIKATQSIRYNPVYYTAFNFKVVAALEINSGDPSDETQWKILKISELSSVYSAYTSIIPAENTVYKERLNNFYADPASEMTLQSKINEVGLQLNQGEYIRIIFYIVDCSNMFRRNQTSGEGGVVKLRLGGFSNYLTSLVSNENKPSLEIYDEQSRYIENIYTGSYNNTVAPIFTTSSTEPNVLFFSPALNPYILTQSLFTPISSTGNLYTNVIDYFGLQKGDLIRMGNFNQLNPKYYTVNKAEFNPRNFPITYSSISWTSTSIPILNLTYNYFQYSYDQYITNQLIVGDIINITSSFYPANSIITTVTSVTPITTQPNTSPYVAVGVSNTIQPAIFDNITINLQQGSISNNSYKVTLTENISSNEINLSSFAFLRPKPDETSIIVNFKKPPGLVSQTILIPEDASTSLTDSIGNIYKQINTQLQ